jgi:hypothetical protein
MDTEQEIRKLKYHAKLLYQALGEVDTYASLAIELDWTEADMSRAHDIFEKYDKQFQDTGNMDGGALERDLRETFNIGYQEVKHIVCVFWKSNQWPDVCKSYAEQFRCSEFREILKGQ